MASNSAAKKELSMHRVPCGPMSIKASGICRRRLRDNFNTLLDRLSEETGPQQPMGPEMPNGYHMMPDGTIMSDAHMQAQEAKKKARKARKDKENDPVNKLSEALKGTLSQGFGEEKLQGNSKMLQDISGEIKPFKEGKTGQSNKQKQ